MADAFISTTTQSNLVRAAVDRYVRAALRQTPMLRSAADTRPVQIDKPGSTVLLWTYTDLAPATTPINETTDPDFVAPANPTSVTVTLNEYGNVTLASARVKNFSFSNIEANQMDMVGYNMRDTMDVLVATVLNGGTNRRYAGGGANTAAVTSQTNLTSADVRYCVANLRTNAAPGRYGELYLGLIHPLVAADLRAESGASGWRQAHIYAAPDVIWPAVIGEYEGVAWVETARTPTQVGGDGTDSGGTGDTDYSTFILGKQALAEAVAIEPHVEIGVVPDRLNRFYPMGWTGILGWNIFRNACLYTIEAGSSLNG